MDEYFCPNCGAILNEQKGFDPSLGTWTCTECGMHLMDDDVYEGDTFEGVAWYCDNCNALLNRQHGFSDSYGTWACTECGHVNGITEDDIITDEYFCPNCGAILNEQKGFDPSLGTWSCTECGTHLMGDDVYYGDTFQGVAWYCDNCNALLNRQHGFSDSYGTWTCTECGHVNGITEDDIINNDTTSDDTTNDDTFSDDDCYVSEEVELECPICRDPLNLPTIL